MSNSIKPPLDEVMLLHFGVKGMRWGVHKRETAPPASIKNSGVLASADGSVNIKPGTNIQRLVTSGKFSRALKDVTYASINEFDNAKYIKTIGGKGLLGGGRDQILSLKVVKPIKAPSIDEATGIVSGMMLRDPAFRKKNTDDFGYVISKKELEKIRADPRGKVAREWYKMTNIKMVYDADFDRDAPYVQKALRKELEDKGFNALRDENDVRSGISKSPLVIFSPEKSLKIVSVTNITDEIRKANKQKLKQYKKNGKAWIDQQVYS